MQEKIDKAKENATTPQTVVETTVKPEELL